jgi:hypothetical protein
MFRSTIREFLLIVTLVAVGLMWWMDRRHLAAELAALRQVYEPVNRQSRFGSAIPEATPTNNRLANSEYHYHSPRQSDDITLAEFIKVLRESKNWYEFADRTADPFAKSSNAADAIPVLIELLQDNDPEIRTRAACALGKIHRDPTRTVPALIPLLEDSHSNVRWHAVLALSMFGGEAQTAMPALQKQIADETSPIGAWSAHMLRKIDPTVDVEPLLIKHLGGKLEVNRQRAANGLAEVGKQRAKDALIDAYARESDKETSEYLAGAIVQIDRRLRSEELK